MNKKTSDEQVARRPGDGTAFIPGSTDKPGSPGAEYDSAKPGFPEAVMYAEEMAAQKARIEFRAPEAYAGVPAMSWSDLSDEQYRVYDFGTYQVRLDNPMKLNVSKSGGHRVYTVDGLSHYIPSGWHHLWWEVKGNTPHFTF
jgi:hypothetical protein